MPGYVEDTRIIDANGTPIDGAHPLPTTADSVYAVDVDVANSDLVGFSGVVTDLFDDLFSVSTDASITNPKTIKVWFKHSLQIYSMGFGCNQTGKNFSNIKMKLFGSDEVIRETVDDSLNDTKYTSKTFEFAPSKANGVIIEFHTADEVCLSNIIIWKVVNVNARLAAISEITGATEGVTSLKGALSVHLADVHNFSINRRFAQPDTASTTVSTASLAGATGVAVTSIAGFTVGDYVEITDGSVLEPCIPRITLLAPGVMTLDRPLDSPYPIGATVERVVTDIAAGTLGTLTTPLSFRVAPPAGEVWHILRLLLSATFTTAADDSKFGNQATLTNGVVLRQKLATGFSTIGNWKRNSDIKLDMFNLPYTEKAGGGLYGMNGLFLFKEFDFVPSLNGDTGDYLEILRQDNLTLSLFEVHAQGHKANV